MAKASRQTSSWTRASTSYLEGPAVSIHKAFEVDAPDTEVVADVWDLCAIGFALFLSDDAPLFRRGGRYHERIGDWFAAKSLFLANQRLEM